MSEQAGPPLLAHLAQCYLAAQHGAQQARMQVAVYAARAFPGMLSEELYISLRAKADAGVKNQRLTRGELHALMDLYERKRLEEGLNEIFSFTVPHG